MHLHEAAKSSKLVLPRAIDETSRKTVMVYCMLLLLGPAFFLAKETCQPDAIGMHMICVGSGNQVVFVGEKGSFPSGWQVRRLVIEDAKVMVPSCQF